MYKLTEIKKNNCLRIVFDYNFEKPYITAESIEKIQRVMTPIVLDSYGLFDKKRVGEWRIIGHQEDYIASDFDDIFLTFGIGSDWKKIDLYGNITKISAEEHLKYISASPLGDYIIKSLIQQIRKNMSNCADGVKEG